MIEERADAVGFPALARAAAALSDAYRAGRPARVAGAERLAAYLVTRMPATYAAAHAVLGEVRRLVGERAVASVLDIGAGTGAASLAARQWFPEARLTLIERDAAMAAAAREWLPDATIVNGDVTRMEALPPHDLVMATYSLGELRAASERTAHAPGIETNLDAAGRECPRHAGRTVAQTCPSLPRTPRGRDSSRRTSRAPPSPPPGTPLGPLVARLWRAAQVALVAIEPGTPRSFTLIRDLRAELLSAGAHMLAPCPGAIECPMAGADWCHFAARVERSSLHRRVKGGALGYEDEKYSYVALARGAGGVAGVAHHPPSATSARPGRARDLHRARLAPACPSRKRDRERFRAARHAAWGDALSGIS